MGSFLSNKTLFNINIMTEILLFNNIFTLLSICFCLMFLFKHQGEFPKKLYLNPISQGGK